MCSQRDELKRQEAHVNIRLRHLQLARGAVIDKLVPRFHLFRRGLRWHLLDTPSTYCER